MRFARWVFQSAGIYGLAVLNPHYFLEKQVSRDYPPPVTHSEYFYGFLGVVWGLLFMVAFRRAPSRVE
jgi:hypothetical protein